MEIFSKGFVHGCGRKLVIFTDFYFRENRDEKCVLNQKKVLYDILDDRNAFLDCKNKKLKKSKNWDFFKGVSPWLWWKIGNFSRFLFQGKQARKMCFTIFQKKETLFQTIKQEVEKVEKLGFSKGVSPWFWSKIGNFSKFLFQGKQG